MTAQNSHDELHPRPAGSGPTDPLGPITMPKRSLIGARAYTLIGAASMFALGINIVTDPGPSTLPTVSAPML